MTISQRLTLSLSLSLIDSSNCDSLAESKSFLTKLKFNYHIFALVSKKKTWTFLFFESKHCNCKNHTNPKSQLPLCRLNLQAHDKPKD